MPGSRSALPLQEPRTRTSKRTNIAQGVEAGTPDALQRAEGNELHQRVREPASERKSREQDPRGNYHLPKAVSFSSGSDKAPGTRTHRTHFRPRMSLNRAQRSEKAKLRSACPTAQPERKLRRGEDRETYPCRPEGTTERPISTAGEFSGSCHDVRGETWLIVLPQRTRRSNTRSERGRWPRWRHRRCSGGGPNTSCETCMS